MRTCLKADEVKKIGFYIFTCALLFSLLLFLLFEYFFLEKSPIPLFYILTLSISTWLVFVILLTNKTENIVLILIIYYLFIKTAFLSAIPIPTLTPYLDSYVIFQISSNILSSGYLLNQPGIYTQGAYITSHQPFWPIFSAMLSEVLGISLFNVLRYIGIIFAPLVILSIYLLYSVLKSNSLEAQKLSLLLFLSSPWLIFFLTWGHYSNASLVFVGILSYIILARLKKPFFSIVFIIAAFGIVFTHFYMSILFIIVLWMYAVFLWIKKTNMHATAIKLCIIYTLVFILYVIWFSSIYIERVMFFFEYIIESIKIGNPFRGYEFYFESGTFSPPFYVILFRYFGAIGWLFFFVCSIYFMITKKIKVENFVFYVFFGIVGVITMLPYLFDPKYGTDLFNRSLYLFGLMFAAPFAAVGFIFLTKTKHLYIKVISCILLISAVNFGLIMTPTDFHSWDYPIRSGEDIRLYQSEWSAAGFFALNKIEKGSEICGLRQGVGKIGYFASMYYYELQPSASNQIPLLKPHEWEKLLTMWTDYCFVRKSITVYPEIGDYIVEKNIFIKVYMGADVIYTTSDVIGIKLQI